MIWNSYKRYSLLRHFQKKKLAMLQKKYFSKDSFGSWLNYFPASLGISELANLDTFINNSFKTFCAVQKFRLSEVSLTRLVVSHCILPVAFFLISISNRSQKSTNGFSSLGWLPYSDVNETVIFVTVFWCCWPAKIRYKHQSSLNEAAW